MAEFRMPALGADMEHGTILEWLVKPGDKVKRGDIVAVIDTEKATIEVENFESGTIQSIVVPVGEKVPIGTVLAVIDTGAEVPVPPPASPPPAVPPPPPPSKMKPPEAPAPPPAPLSSAGGRMRISPLAMRVALDLKVDLSNVKGTGPDGAITRADVERAAKGAPSPAAAG
ncbi:MAG TPA: biotin/lipoyl-containing protein, partial [Candidatus Binataceae bacterium]|nr:biotin/lipoyl-containing protein [Candidatus Binataceae bacterium]